MRKFPSALDLKKPLYAECQPVRRHILEGYSEDRKISPTSATTKMVAVRSPIIE